LQEKETNDFLPAHTQRCAPCLIKLRAGQKPRPVKFLGGEKHV